MIALLFCLNPAATSDADTTTASACCYNLTFIYTRNTASNKLFRLNRYHLGDITGQTKSGGNNVDFLKLSCVKIITSNRFKFHFPKENVSDYGTGKTVPILSSINTMFMHVIDLCHYSTPCYL